MASDSKKDYEVLHRIRLDDNTLVKPASEERPGTSEAEVKTISLTEEEAQPFLATEAIRPVPTRRDASEEEEPSTHVAPVSPAPSAPPVEGSEATATLAEAFGEDTAQILEDAGYTSVAEVQSASDEILLGIDGVGPKTLEKIRAADNSA